MLKRPLALIFLATAGSAAAQGIDLQGNQLSLLDTNSDGNVTREEFQVFVDGAYRQLDTDGDGSLTSSELAPLLPADAIFELDANGDGVVSPQEFSIRMSADFDTADTDGDGVLN